MDPSVAFVFFERRLKLLGYTNPANMLFQCVKTLTENAIDACSNNPPSNGQSKLPAQASVVEVFIVENPTVKHMYDITATDTGVGVPVAVAVEDLTDLFLPSKQNKQRYSTAREAKEAMNSYGTPGGFQKFASFGLGLVGVLLCSHSTAPLTTGRLAIRSSSQSDDFFFAGTLGLTPELKAECMDEGAVPRLYAKEVSLRGTAVSVNIMGDLTKALPLLKNYFEALMLFSSSDSIRIEVRFPGSEFGWTNVNSATSAPSTDDMRPEGGDWEECAHMAAEIGKSSLEALQARFARQARLTAPADSNVYNYSSEMSGTLADSTGVMTTHAVQCIAGIVCGVSSDIKASPQTGNAFYPVTIRVTRIVNACPLFPFSGKCNSLDAVKEELCLLLAPFGVQWRSQPFAQEPDSAAVSVTINFPLAHRLKQEVVQSINILLAYRSPAINFTSFVKTGIHLNVNQATLIKNCVSSSVNELLFHNQELFNTKQEMQVIAAREVYHPSIADSLLAIVTSSPDPQALSVCMASLGANTEQEAHERLSKMLADLTIQPK